MKKKRIFINYLFFLCILLCNCKNTKLIPKMIKIQNNFLNIEISETLVTMKNYKEFVIENNIMSISDFERRMITKQDIYYEIEFNDDWPLWGITWREAAEYCNWLSKKSGYQPCYIFKTTKENPEYGEVIIDRTANGYRMPYIRELLIISGMKNGLSKEQYESENLCNLEKDINKWIPMPVYDGKKNKYGIYDVLGNFGHYCNDYYNEEYDYFDYSLSPYGPETYTPDLDQIWYNEPLTAVRCYYGGYWFDTYESIQNRDVFDANEISIEFAGIRLVRDLN